MYDKTPSIATIANNFRPPQPLSEMFISLCLISANEIQFDLGKGGCRRNCD